jgi:phage I-like protein
MTKNAPNSITPRNKRVQILRVGTFRDMSNTEHTFSEADLEHHVAAINAQVAAKFEPPLCKGHPAHDDPRFGSVKGAVKEGNKAFVEVDEITPAFASSCRQGEYKYVSPAFYANGGLRHVGVLGAMNPAIKGMDAIAFGEGMFAEADKANGTDGLMVFQEPLDWQSLFGNALQCLVWKIQSFGNVLRGMRDTMIADKGLEAADKAIPDYAVSSLENADDVLKDYKFGEGDASVVDPSKDNSASPPTEAPAANLDSKPSAGDGEAERLRAEVGVLNAKLKERDDAEKTRAFGDRLNQLATEGRLAANMRPHLERIHSSFLALPLDGEGMFGEGESRVKPDDILNALLGSLPKLVEFGEHAPGAPPASIDPQEVAKQITAHIEKAEHDGRTLSFAEAAIEVSNINRSPNNGK